MTRKQARDTAFKLIYQMQIQKENSDFILDLYHGQYLCQPGAKEYIDNVVNGVFENKNEIDAQISKLLEGWKLERISKISYAAIRLSVYEIVYRSDIPDSVSINEAVQLAKKYEGEQAANFVNGVLAALIKQREGAK
ncbi:MAG: transcription antitermination factor NusB [Firmicutes bacterium]|nr:transcription antitermination factor NusB [Bacillota bacterium]